MRRPLLAILFLAVACGESGPPLLGVQEVSVGGNHVCALLDDGRVQCWGDPRRGEGSGPAGMPVPDIENVANVEAGSQHTCVRHTDQTVSCWGYDLHRELGGGSPVPGIPLAERLTVGSGKSCVIGTAGELWCWGNGSGIVDGGDLSPTHFDLGAPVTDVAPASSHICALTDAGALFCWGSNGQDEYGDASIAESTSPVEIASLTGLTDVVQGHQHTCGMRGPGEVVCWGYTYASPPVVIEGLPAVAELSAGFRHSCALATDGRVFCWGANDRGQLGDGSSMASSTTPREVRGLSDAVRISATSDVTCALRADTSVVCWGKGTEGRLGDGSTEDRREPVTVLASP